MLPRIGRYGCFLLGLVLADLPVQAGARPCPAVVPGRPAGIYLQPSRVARQGRFEFLEKVDPTTHKREDYVKQPGAGAAGATLFFSHEREIAVTVGHRGRVVLVNDYFATKACRVIVANLRTRSTRNVSAHAVRLYDHELKPDMRLIVIPQGYGLSPDDGEVLIGMDLIYTSAPNAAVARSLDKNYERRWYVVRSSTGRVIHEYRIELPPSCWWTY